MDTTKIKGFDQIRGQFEASTVKTLKTMCKVDPECRPAYQKGSQSQTAFEVGGIIGLTSSDIRGSVGIYFPKSVFLNLLSAMLGENVTAVDDRNESAAAELLNIIFGDAKACLNQLGHDFKMAIPNVIRGNNVVAPASKALPPVVVPFQTSTGEFYLEFAFAELKESEKIVVSSSNAASGSIANQQKAAFFKPFVDGTVSTFKVQCGIDASPGTPAMKSSTKNYSFDIMGFIGITSSTIVGSYGLSFKKDVFVKLLSRMFGEEISELQPGMEDGVCELLNIILGTAKATLNDQQGHAIQMAIPQLVQGDMVRSNPQKGKTTIVIPFYSDVGRFMVEVTMD